MEVRARPGEPVDKLIKRFMRKQKQSGIDRQWMDRQYYMKPSERRRRKHEAALRQRERDRAP